MNRCDNPVEEYTEGEGFDDYDDGDDPEIEKDEAPDITFEELGTTPIKNMEFLKESILKPILGKTRLRKGEIFIDYNPETEDLLIELGKEMDPRRKRVLLSAEPVRWDYAEKYRELEKQISTYRDIDNLLENIIFEDPPRDVYPVDITKWREKKKAKELLYRLPSRQERELETIRGERIWKEEFEELSPEEWGEKVVEILKDVTPSLSSFEEARLERRKLIEGGIVIPSDPKEKNLEYYKVFLSRRFDLEDIRSKRVINDIYDLATQIMSKIRYFSGKYLTEWMFTDAGKIAEKLIGDQIIIPRDTEIFGIYIGTFMYYIASMMEHPNIDVSRIFPIHIRIPGYEERLHSGKRKKEAPSSYLETWQRQSDKQKSLVWPLYRMMARTIKYSAKPMRQVDDWDIYSYIMMKMEDYGNALVESVIINASETAVIEVVSKKKNRNVYGNIITSIFKKSKDHSISEIRNWFNNIFQEWALFQFFQYFQYLAKKKFERAFRILRDQLR